MKFLPHLQAVFTQSLRQSVRCIYRLPILMYVVSILAVSNVSSTAQTRLAGPANWLYPLGNAQATRRQDVPSDRQDIRNVGIKWSTSFMRGMQPLVGNLVANTPVGRVNPLNDQVTLNRFAPNEIVGYSRGQIVVINGGTGEIITSQTLGNEFPFIRGISFLFDGQSSLPIPQEQTSPGLMMGFSVSESGISLSSREAFAASYLANITADTVRVIKRMLTRLDEYAPNRIASVTPFFSRTDRIGADTVIFAQINMSQPVQLDLPTGRPPYYRGVAQYNTQPFFFPAPRPDIVDFVDQRHTLGFDVSFAQPSINISPDRQINALLPIRPTPGFTATIGNALGFPASFGERPYIWPVRLDSNIMAPGGFYISDQDLSVTMGINFASRPKIRPLYVDLNPDGLRDFTMVLIAEEYDGTGTSGTPRLHLFNPVTQTPFTQVGVGSTSPPFSLGSTNHEWSIAVGDVDGVSENSFEPFFPNNRGREIILTQSTQNFDVPGNRLCVLRFRTDQMTPRPPQLGGELFPLDTIATERINGWVAAVNDFDSAPDGKEEIFVVFNDSLKVYRLRNYRDFDLGRTFDLVWARRFFGEAPITGVVIADGDGDGRNDIIVTTAERTYLLGTSSGFDGVGSGNDAFMPLQIVQPSRIFDGNPNARPSACIGSPIEFTYRVNVFPRSRIPALNIFYQPYNADGRAVGQRILLASNFNITANTGFSGVYRTPANLSQFGLFGRVIIQSVRDSLIRDSSAIIRFTTTPEIQLFDLPQGITRQLNDTISVFGRGQCVTGFQMQYLNRTTGQFVNINATIESGGGVFKATMRLPECLPGAFGCGITPTSTSPIEFRAVSTGVQIATGASVITSNRVVVSLLPVNYPLFVSDNEKMPNQICEARFFSITNLPQTLTVTTLTYSYSLNNGATFIPIGTQPYTPGSTTALVTWVPPPDLPSEVLVRICSDGGCINGQGILRNPSPTYINSIAPNPFNPDLHGMMYVIYVLPRATTVTVRIFDGNNRLVKEIGAGGDLAGGVAHRACWDGNLSDGNRAGAGMYYVVLEFDDRRETYPIFVTR